MHVARNAKGAYRQGMSEWCPRCGRRQPLRTPLTEAVARLLECGIRFRKSTNRDELEALRRKAVEAREKMVAAMDAEISAMDALLAATPVPPPRPAVPAAPDPQLSFIGPPAEIAPALVALKSGRRVHAPRPQALPPPDNDDGNRWAAPPPSELRELGEHLLSA